MIKLGNPSKRFGARYGNRIRKNVDEAEDRTEERCIECESTDVERTTAGVWECNECGVKFAGGAYKSETGAKEMMTKALNTGLEVEELEEAKEKIGDE